MAREPFNQIWAEAPTQFEEPPTDIWQDGWTGGPVEDPPEAKWQNWWQNRADVALSQIERDGAMEWLASVPYQRWAKVVGSNGTRYTSVQASQGVDPVTDDGTSWVADREPSGLGFSLTENGWYSFPGGLILQWGQAETVDSVAISSLPVEFPNSPLRAWGTHSASSGAQPVAVVDISNTSVTLGMNSGNNGAIFFFVIGY